MTDYRQALQYLEKANALNPELNNYTRMKELLLDLIKKQQSGKQEQQEEQRVQ